MALAECVGPPQKNCPIRQARTASMRQRRRLPRARPPRGLRARSRGSGTTARRRAAKKIGPGRPRVGAHCEKSVESGPTPRRLPAARSTAARRAAADPHDPHRSTWRASCSSRRSWSPRRRSRRRAVRSRGRPRNPSLSRVPFPPPRRGPTGARLGGRAPGVRRQSRRHSHCGGDDRRRRRAGPRLHGRLPARDPRPGHDPLPPRHRHGPLHDPRLEGGPLRRAPASAPHHLSPLPPPSPRLSVKKKPTLLPRPGPALFS